MDYVNLVRPSFAAPALRGRVRWTLGLCSGLLLGLLLGGCDVGGPPATATAPAATATPAPPTAAPTDTPEPGPSPTGTLAPGQFANPVLDQDFPDPDVLHVGDTYYAYATNANSINIQVARSTNLVEWRILADALPVLPPWASPGNTWAPEVTTTTTGSYVMYFAARKAGGRFQCIGVATSTEPQGPFRSRATEPLICPLDEGGAIDPSSFTDDDGTRYVLWKNDGNCCGDATHLYLQKVSGDGLTLDGPPTALVENDQTWEADVVEAPTLVKHGGKYYLFYSANAYNTERYSVGYAEADSITGPYRKATDPLLRSRLTRPPVVGPGGQDVVLDLKGRTWMLYHAWDPTISYRTLNLDPLNWEGDKPVVQGPTRGPEQAP